MRMTPGASSISHLVASRSGVKWVFKVKRDEHEVVSKHKVRLVVKGYAQRHDIDYDEIFALVAQFTHRAHGARVVGGAPYGCQISVLER
jgi:hypothetical protein